MPSSKRKPASASSRVSRGHSYERAAEAFLTARGFEVVERNWRSGHKEIDLIVQKGNLIVFVEVKSAQTPKFGHPVERVDKRKVKNLTEAAESYIETKGIVGCDLRFDVVAFVDGKPEHFPDAFGVE